ncbi:transcriptional regulator [Pseudomonas tremae]|uniref:transcriptional regulator n=1 Tax=Pseudomonas tremae TaxID=200454 RepID=UPI001F31CF24|nr:transcriptional regulator [Pseudomonas tremae]MCF5806417.1 transcriptional regulator [Pseudomonas tremae]MCF5811611.1 transcriptional regulator [Pseudomonas tremae]
MTKKPVTPSGNLSDRLRARLAEKDLHEKEIEATWQDVLSSSQGSLAAHEELSYDEITKGIRFTDTYIETLRKYIRSKGGTLEITANFPDGKMTINKLSQ